MAILTKDGKAVPFHGDHHPVSVVQGRKSRNLLRMTITEPETKSGITITPIGNGGIHVEGVRESYAVIEIGEFAEDVSGTMYFRLNTNQSLQWSLYNGEVSTNGTRTGDYNKGSKIYLKGGSNGAVLNCDVYPMVSYEQNAEYDLPYGTVTDTIFKPADLKKSGTPLTFEQSYNHTAELEVQGRSVQASFTGKNLLDGYVDSGNLWSVAVTYEDDPDTATGKRMKVTTLAANKDRLYIGRSQYPYDKLVAGKTYTVSLKVKASRDFGVSVFPFCETSGTRTTVAKPLNTEWQQISMTFEFLSGTQYAALYLIYPSWGGATFTENDAVYFADIQLEESTSATTYEPYCGGIPSPSPDYPQPIESIDSVELVSRNADGTKSTTRTIDLQGHELRSLPDGTRDEVMAKRDGSVELVQRVGVVDLGTFNYTYYAGYDGFYSPAFSLPGGLSARDLPNTYCTCFTPTTDLIFGANPTINGLYAVNVYGSFRARIIGITNPLEFKQRMSGQKLIYELATPVTIPLPSIDPLPTYYPYTFIDGNGNDISASVLVLPED